MSNYYGYTSQQPSNQSYGLSTASAASYGGSYGMQQPSGQQSYMTSAQPQQATTPVVQTQQYATYQTTGTGAIGVGVGVGSSQSYQASYSYSSNGYTTAQNTSYNGNQTSQASFYQQPRSITGSQSAVTTSYYSHPSDQQSTNNNSGSYSTNSTYNTATSSYSTTGTTNYGTGASSYGTGATSTYGSGAATTYGTSNFGTGGSSYGTDTGASSFSTGGSSYGTGGSSFTTGVSAYGTGGSAYGTGGSAYGTGGSAYGTGGSAYGTGVSGYGTGISISGFGNGTGSAGFGTGTSGYATTSSRYGNKGSLYGSSTSNYGTGNSSYGSGSKSSNYSGPGSSNTSSYNDPRKTLVSAISKIATRVQSESTSLSNYEKALISATTSMYQQKGKDAGGSSSANKSAVPYIDKSLPTWKQKRILQKESRDPNKPIAATEVKAYLYAWLGKFRSKPEYHITSHGTMPYRQMYVCELVAPGSGFDYVGKGAATNKKDAQTRSAWDFCDYLIGKNIMKSDELPTRESKFEASKNNMPSTYQARSVQETTAAIAKNKTENSKVNFVGGQQLQTANQSQPMIMPKPAGPTKPPSLSTSFIPAGTKPPPPLTPPQPPAPPSGPPTPLMSVEVLHASEENESTGKGPIGENYVERLPSDGRVVRFRCKLCECEFNDASAKDLHIRGRRHRLTYKKKVDPNTEVDVKLNPKQKQMMLLKMRHEKRRQEMMEQQKKRMQWRLEMQRQEEEEMRAYEEEMYYQYQDQLVQFEEEMELCRRRGIIPPPHLVPPARPPMRFFRPLEATVQQTQQIKTRDDQHVIAKHTEIYPNECELLSVQKAVQIVEAALKEVSNKIHEQEMLVVAASNVHVNRPPPERLLKAVLRIGDLAKGLLLHGCLTVEIVLMCNEKPTMQLLKRVADHLPEKLETKCVDGIKCTVAMEKWNAAIVVVLQTNPPVTVSVNLTATQMRPVQAENEKPTAGDKKEGSAPADKVKKVAANTDDKPDPPDILDRGKCCRSLAALRHSKWFQAKANGLQSCVLITRIIKDLCKRVPTWTPLSSWAVELLVERCISSSALPLSPSDGLQRVLETMASGILLNGGPGISDPCERTPTDAVASLTAQEREDITASAQHALRLLAFRQIHKVLGMDPLPVEGPGTGAGDPAMAQRKRPAAESTTEQEEKMDCGESATKVKKEPNK